MLAGGNNGSRDFTEKEIKSSAGKAQLLAGLNANKLREIVSMQNGLATLYNSPRHACSGVWEERDIGFKAERRRKRRHWKWEMELLPPQSTSLQSFGS